MTYLKRVRRWTVENEQGAEIAEWVIWTGGLAITAGALYTAIAMALPSAMQNIVGSLQTLTGP